MAVKKINESKNKYNLGDEVKWKNDYYVIIHDSDDEDLLTLRPKDRFKETDFDDIESGDSSEDVYLARYQLESTSNKISEDDLIPEEVDPSEVIDPVESKRLVTISFDAYVDYGESDEEIEDNIVEGLRSVGYEVDSSVNVGGEFHDTYDDTEVVTENDIEHADDKNPILTKWVDYLDYNYSYEVINWKDNGNSVELRTPTGYEISLTYTSKGIKFINITGSDEPVIYGYNDFKRFVSDMFESGFDIDVNEENYENYEEWEEIDSKSVTDSDGFLTDYTLYFNGTTYITMFGDKEIYEPDIEYADFESDSESEAREWFDSYEGFTDEDESVEITEDDIVTEDIDEQGYINVMNYIDEFATTGKTPTDKDISKIRKMANDANIDVRDFADANDCGDCDNWSDVIKARRANYEAGEVVETDIVTEETNEDEYDDEEFSNIYGGDRSKCPECGSSNYHDGRCYKCEPVTDDEIEEM